MSSARRSRACPHRAPITVGSGAALRAPSAASERPRLVHPADASVLDDAVLAELLTSTGEDVAFVRDLLETYLAETPEQLDAIRAAVASNDAAGLVRPAHTLKSSSATLGAMRLSSLG